MATKCSYLEPQIFSPAVEIEKEFLFILIYREILKFRFKNQKVGKGLKNNSSNSLSRTKYESTIH